MIQIVRKAAEEWEVIRVDSPTKGTHEYELIGRVIMEADKLYYVDMPNWHDKGYEWVRHPRGYLLAKAALRVITDPPVKVLS